MTSKHTARERLHRIKTEGMGKLGDLDFLISLVEAAITEHAEGHFRVCGGCGTTTDRLANTFWNEINQRMAEREGKV